MICYKHTSLSCEEICCFLFSRTSKVNCYHSNIIRNKWFCGKIELSVVASLELIAKLKKVKLLPKTNNLCPQITKWVLLNVIPGYLLCKHVYDIIQVIL